VFVAQRLRSAAPPLRRTGHEPRHRPLRPTGGEPPYTVVAVTADPAEGESFTQAGDDLVAAVPIPAAVRDMLEAFIVEHHVEQPFFKRERERADPDGLARRRPTKKDKGR
jgi:hypothetical protein